MQDKDLTKHRGMERTCFFTCRNCGHQWSETFSPTEWIKFKLFGTECPNCGEKNYSYRDVTTILSIALAISFASVSIALFL